MSLNYNWLHLSKGDEKLFIPDVFETELKSVMSQDQLEKFKATMKVSKEEFDKELPEVLEEEVVTGVLKFIETHEKKSIVESFEKEIEDMSTEIEARRDEPRPKRTRRSPRNSSRSKSKKVDKVTQSIDSEETTEEKFRELMKEVTGRIKKIKFEKDDHKLYSDVNGQVDSLLFEAIREINQIKKTLKQKFERSQKAVKAGGSTSRRGTRRTSRDRGDTDLRIKKSNSVFSKDQLTDDDQK